MTKEVGVRQAYLFARISKDRISLNQGFQEDSWSGFIRELQPTAVLNQGDVAVASITIHPTHLMVEKSKTHQRFSRSPLHPDACVSANPAEHGVFLFFSGREHHVHTGCLFIPLVCVSAVRKNSCFLSVHIWKSLSLFRLHRSSNRSDEDCTICTLIPLQWKCTCPPSKWITINI